MEITLGFGIDLLPFGLTERQIVEVAGEPDKAYSSDGNNKRLQYNNLLIELSFEGENDARFGWIEVHNPKAKIFGHQLIGSSFSDVLAIVGSVLAEPPEIDDYGSFISAFYPDSQLELQFSFNKLTNINFGTLFGEDDEPIWPTT